MASQKPQNPGLFGWAEGQGKDSPKSAEVENEGMSVAEVNRRAKDLLERHLGTVAVVGEIAGFKQGRNGHCYFSLREEGAAVSAALFAGDARRLNFRPKEGELVLARGRLTIYGPSGRYQIVCRSLSRVGAGNLQREYERLRKKLDAEGLFAQERKRKLGWLPGRVAVVTSPTGAVIRDIIHVARRRFGAPDIVIIPSAVQGPDAARGLVRAISEANQRRNELGLSAIILARGGGSLEDLWCFNDESLARRVAASELPIVSGVGHETDTTLADWAADVRAPTPSAAAELVFPEVASLGDWLDELVERGRIDVQGRCREARLALGRAERALRRPTLLTRVVRERFNEASLMLERTLRASLTRLHRRLQLVENGVQTHHPRRRLEVQRHRLEGHRSRLMLRGRRLAIEPKARLRVSLGSLNALSPLKVLERGYSILQTEEGDAVRGASEVSEGQRLYARLREGSLDLAVTGRRRSGEAFGQKGDKAPN